MNIPPPKFNLDSISPPPQKSSQGLFSPKQSQKKAVVLHPAVSFANAPMKTGPVQSGMLVNLTNTPSGYPCFEDAMNATNFPFLESARQHRPINYGVLKLKNIPFATKRSEIAAFLGRNAKILSDFQEPIHIIMERVTSKTMDAYVEFQTLDEAMKTAEKHHINAVNGRASRLGDRPIDVELSSQGSLMRDLFPLAVGVYWENSTPKFKPINPAAPWENFKGFISAEEMTMLVKHVEVPHRSPFSKECPQRPYECLISTLRKFPWNITDRITIAQRQAIYEATCELIRLLSRSILRRENMVDLNVPLFKRVVEAGLSCPGFSPLMKDDIAYLANSDELTQRSHGQPRFAHLWRHQHALAVRPGIPLDMIEWYIGVIREQTERDINARPLSVRTALVEQSEDTNLYWGYYWAEIGYPMGPQFDSLTLSDAAQMELSAIERILARAFPRKF